MENDRRTAYFAFAQLRSGYASNGITHHYPPKDPPNSTRGTHPERATPSRLASLALCRAPLFVGAPEDLVVVVGAPFLISRAYSKLQIATIDIIARFIHTREEILQKIVEAGTKPWSRTTGAIKIRQ